MDIGTPLHGSAVHDLPGAARALLLVRNGVTHDARVLRAAKVLRGLGAEVLVVGVSTATAPAGRTVVEDVDVIRVPGTLRVGGRAGDRSGGLGGPDARPAPRGPATGVGGARVRAAPGADPAPATRPPDAGRATARSASAPVPGIADAPGWTARAAARRTVRATAYARGAVAVARAWRPTVVHANDHNTMWPALAIRRITGARVLYDSHELWADRNGRPEWRPGLLASEAAFVRAADGLITASPGYSRALAERHRIPTPPAVRNIPVGDAVPSTGPRPGPPEVVYVGGLMRGRGLELTIDALPLAPGVRFRIVGPGPAAYAAALEDRARARGVADRVVLAGAVPPGEVVAAAAGATLGLALIEPICRSYELTLPNKLFEYVRAAVPVLSSPVPVLAGVVREHGLGVVSASLDVADVAAAIRAGVDPAAQERMRSATTAYAATATWDAEAEVLAGVYRSILGRPGSSAS